jgi:oxygen-independent coproporphyrinogen III oxidase
MAGIYLHIPFCKKACHYCDFHFSTSLQLKEPLLHALKKEILWRKDELQGERIETIYFGGGTPSLLSIAEINSILDLIFTHYPLESKMEITLEANPDDLSDTKLKELKSSSVNRFSIGVQSFFDEDLLYMNRAHDARESERAIKASQDAGFENLTIDLIYGTPTLTDANWIENLRKTVSFQVPHVSCYALTVEEKTPLASLIKSKKRVAVDDAKVADHFHILTETLPASGLEHYEISNFATPGFRSKHNSSYWHGKPYLGFGPSAHSYNGLHKRRWNISNNPKYIQEIEKRGTYFEEEMLDQKDRFNEYIMTRIRLIEGISMDEVNLIFGTEFLDHLKVAIENWNENWYAVQNNSIVLTTQGKLISDNLASRLFLTKS